MRAGLDALGIGYTMNPRMVRGLDYYTRTTFEFVHPGLGAQSGIGGGGRYDGLMAELGGQPLSGIGWGLGVDRTLLAAQAEGLTVGDSRGATSTGFRWVRPRRRRWCRWPVGCAAPGSGSTCPTADGPSRAR